MANDLVRSSKHAATDLLKEDIYDVTEFARYSGKIVDIDLIAQEQMTLIAEDAIRALAGLTISAASTSRRLTDAGVRSDIFNEGSLMILQVTKQNVGVLTNAGQQAIAEEAVSRFR